MANEWTWVRTCTYRCGGVFKKHGIVYVIEQCGGGSECTWKVLRVQKGSTKTVHPSAHSLAVAKRKAQLDFQLYINGDID